MLLLAADECSGQTTALAMPLLPVSAVLEAVQRLPGPKHDLWRDVRMRACTLSMASALCLVGSLLNIPTCW
jgi:hypothetical protein